jgi:hypothetical protein
MSLIDLFIVYFQCLTKEASQVYLFIIETGTQGQPLVSPNSNRDPKGHTMKNLALRSAIAASVFLGAASAASAGEGFNNLFFDDYEQRSNSRIEVDLVRSETGGTVEVVEMIGGAMGDSLGTTPVRAGANKDVFIHFSTLPASNDVAVILRDSAGNIVDIEEIDIDNF